MRQRPAQIISLEALQGLRPVTPDAPLRVLLSACLNLRPCLYDGTGLSGDDFFADLLKLPTLHPLFFCPEDFSFGTPRGLSDIHGGNGFDVLDGRARVLTSTGEDWTEGMLRAADKMLNLALGHRAELAILLDISAACGVQVISEGDRTVPDRKYQRGPGLCAARLIRAGIPVISQRDDRSLHLLRSHLEPGFEPDPSAQDHHEREWYVSYFTAE